MTIPRKSYYTNELRDNFKYFATLLSEPFDAYNVIGAGNCIRSYDLQPLAMPGTRDAIAEGMDYDIADCISIGLGMLLAITAILILMSLW